MIEDANQTRQDTLNLSEIKNSPLRQRIADLLREAIFSGELQPGQDLTEASIAHQLKVSRAPVREAFHLLSKEGLLESIPYKGTTIRKLNQQDIEETYSLRELLESFAIRRIISSAQAVDLRALEDCCHRMESYARQGNIPLLSAEDERFHNTVIKLAEHNLLSTMWATLSLRVRQILALRNQQNQDPMEVALNHPPIVTAIRHKDLQAALKLIHQHVTSAADIDTTDPQMTDPPTLPETKGIV